LKEGRRIRYELLGASQVVVDLSAIADIPVLPQNEAQARPITRLKAAEHRRQAWKLALKMAASSGRPVTARDTEEAVKRLSDKANAIPVDGVPVLDRLDGLRAAYAEPPYVGQAQRRYGCGEADYEELIERLETYDAWALSLSSPSLQRVLLLCPDGAGGGAWVKPCVQRESCRRGTGTSTPSLLSGQSGSGTR
jgi:hypothetical protein